MEKNLVEKIEFLQKEFFPNTEVLLIFYNPSMEDSLREKDEKWLVHYLEQIELTRATVIIYGRGGCLTSGLLMAYLFRKNFTYYDVFTPFGCCSALVYPILKANRLITTDFTCITQIDPIIKVDIEGTTYEKRLIESLQDKDNTVRRMAIRTYNSVRDRIKTMLFEEKPSIVDPKSNYHLTDVEKLDQVIDLFLRKENHHSELSHSDFEDLGLKVKKINSMFENNHKKLIETMREVVSISQNILLEKEGSFLYCSSKKLKDYEERILIRSIQDSNS